MSRTTGRTMALLGLLQSRREWSGEQLRERLEVSDRTLRRDIEDLRSLGYGIEATRGLHGGYRLGPGAAVPPLALAREEAVAIAVGLRAVAMGVVAGMEESSVSALAKLERSLGALTRKQIGEIANAMLPLPGANPAIDITTLTTVAQAIRDTTRIRLRYRRHDGEKSLRTVEPHRIVYTPRVWYLIAWDVQRRAWRTLRMDRISDPSRTTERFTARTIPDHQVQDFTTKSISVAPYRYRAVLRVHAPAAEVRRTFGPTIAHVEDNGDGTCTLTTGANAPEEIAIYLGASGFVFEVICGDELRRSIHGLIGRLSAAVGSA